MDIRILKSMLGWTWATPVSTKHRVFQKMFLFGSTKINSACYVWTVTNVCVSGCKKICAKTKILFEKRDDPFGNCCAFIRGTALRFLPPELRMIGTVVPK